MHSEYKNIDRQLERIMREAGDILLKFFGTNVVGTYKNGQELSTEADCASEQYLIAELTKLYDGVGICAEESGLQGASDYQWVIDPLDGTTNFVHGIDYFCISVALTHNAVPLFGAIYAPAREQFFYAERGKGAFLNGNPIAVSARQELCGGVVVVGFAHTQTEHDQLSDTIRMLMQKGVALRVHGATALDLAQVASGRFDGAFFMQTRWWDVAAGILLVCEAGGLVTDFEGNLMAPGVPACLAGSMPYYQLLRSVLNV